MLGKSSCIVYKLMLWLFLKEISSRVYYIHHRQIKKCLQYVYKIHPIFFIKLANEQQLHAVIDVRVLILFTIL